MGQVEQLDSSESMGELRLGPEQERAVRLDEHIHDFFFHVRSLRVLNNTTADLTKTLTTTHRAQISINHQKFEHRTKALEHCQRLQRDLSSAGAYDTFFFRVPMRIQQPSSDFYDVIQPVNGFTVNWAESLERGENVKEVEGLRLTNTESGAFIVLEDIGSLATIYTAQKIEVT